MAPEMIGSEFSPIGARGGKKPSKKLKVPKEVKGGKATPRNNTKADMYSLGVNCSLDVRYAGADCRRH